ncbi:MAG: UDP-N-acetylglucosamine diphosphorylase/glucosamine-1-phosphate N-acetyltransferase [Candidatus Saccharicenans sp.]|nr:UDP-N-acetylglucosamine diphosphorylase/glucosamine-1-phosphate N-acetyltransferase [Candidatus Saccharicenans sp.]
MKKKLLVLACGDEISSGQKKDLPSIISASSLLSHRLEVLMKLRPERIGLLVAEPGESGKLRKNRLKLLPAGVLASTLSALMEMLKKKRAAGDLILLSPEFFPKEAGLIKKVLTFHQKSGHDLTLIGERVDPDRDQLLEDYFVRPGLALISFDGNRRWQSRVRPFKPSGQLDVVALVEAAWEAGLRIGFYWLKEAERDSFIPVNSLADYSRVAEYLRQAKIAELERRGVFFLDPGSAWIDSRAKVGSGTIIYPSVVIEGRSRVGKNCLIYPYCHIMDSRLGNGVKVFGATVIEGCRIEHDVQVGPFSRLRPETRLRRGSRVGNFVEMKKTVFGEGSKAMHLSYLGDTRVEGKVNVGAGTITCNYDGFKKNRTFIGREAFIGSGTELVAPVRVGRGAYVAAGSTITENVKPEALAIARARQVQKPGWVRNRKAKVQTAGKRAPGKKGK